MADMGPIEQLETPALLLDWPTSRRNLDRMAQFLQGKSVRLRPHFKNHKCVSLSRRQLESGSTVGMTCAKLSEAEVLVDNGFDDVLIANQVVGRSKVQRLVDSAKRAKVAVAVDDHAQAVLISEAAHSAHATVHVLVEVDIGMGRCGVPPGEPAIGLAKKIAQLPGLSFDGLQAYEGHAVYIDDRKLRTAEVRKAMQPACDTCIELERSGLNAMISGGSSSTYAATSALEGVTELQCGTYVTMDWRYNELAPEFDIALSILTTVISRPQPGAAVLDVGFKGLGCEFGLPRVKGHPEAKVSSCSEEHTIVSNIPDWKVGQMVELHASHACTTCNLYRQMNVYENGRVVDTWPIEGSGKLA